MSNGTAWKKSLSFLQKVSIHLPYGSVNPLIDVDPKEMQMYVHRKISEKRFITVIFVKAEYWKQHRCLATGE